MKTITYSPWGPVQHAEVIADGIVQVDTASHGGFFLSPARLLQMPREFHGFNTWAGGPWFEEDCDATLVVLSFPDLFSPSWVKNALDYIRADYFVKDKKVNVESFLASEAGRLAITASTNTL